MKKSLKLVAIVGPTATGKTRLGVELAHRLGSQILSADSRQVYRGLDLGTGKDLADYSKVEPPVPYHLIDVAEPSDIYTLFDYQRDCFAVLRKLALETTFGSGEVPLVMVGGSGLYIEAVLQQYALADVAEDPALRQRLAHLSIEELRDRLRREAPDQFERTDTSSRRRLIRGLEIAAASARGPVISTEPLGLDLDVRVVGIDVDRKTLRSRIATRLAERLQAGMVNEVRDLLEGGLPRSRLESLGLEYRAVGAFLAGRRTYQGMVRDLNIRIGQFAKRQQTWFRGMARRGLDVTWVEPGDIHQLIHLTEGW
ncbi:MAG: tRNA (adenosine(37)-N6)-dimethylallyltransferase MiaA [Thermoanaerobaculales bacterium]|nr:tRNA (adenosine(37)-N6)-dimethylallyltransferase MiaA [Thermoanaerobaculales bacterium]